MNSAQLTVEEMLYQSGLRINNSLSDPIVLNAVAPFGYTELKLNEGAQILADATALVEKQKEEYGDVDAAQSDFVEKRDTAKQTYTDMLEIARIALKKDVKAISTLDLNGRRASTFSGWLRQCQNFYHALLANEAWKTAMAAFGQTAEILQAQSTAVDEVALASETRKKEMGDAQNATKLRDDKLEELDEWVNDYEVIAKIALVNTPQLQEKLGIIVAS